MSETRVNVKLDGLTRFFTDTTNEKLAQPFRYNARVWASDGYTFISIPEEDTEDDYIVAGSTQKEMADKLATMIGISKTVNRTIDVSKLDKLLTTIPQVPVYAECSACDGDGNLECPHCGQEYECDKCDGTGKSNEVIGRKFDSAAVFIEGAYLAPRFLQRAVQVAYFTESPLICVGIDGNGLWVFKSGSVIFGIMKMAQSVGRVYSFLVESLDAPN